MKIKLYSVALLGISGSLVACAPTPRFEWGTYEHALYAYAQNPENREAYKLSLEGAIERGRKRNAIAPGLLAELGYLHLEQGNSNEALRYFREERALFPESAVLMDRVISKTGQISSSAGNQ